MANIRLLTASRAVGDRLYAILYQAGFSGISQIKSLQEYAPDDILIVYHRTRISEVIQRLSDTPDAQYRVIVLLDPDQFAMYADRARHLGLTVLLMPAAPYLLLESVQEASLTV